MFVFSIVSQVFLVLLFGVAGIGKILGSPLHINNFTHWRLPHWFRVFTGIIEILGVISLLIGIWYPIWVAAGALLLGVTAIGGILTHLRAKDSFKETYPILILALLAFFVFFEEVIHLQGFLWFGK